MDNKFEKQTVEILWTGGFDSSFRIVQLSRMPVIIQPYYLSDNRVSEQMELSAIDRITERIRNDPDAQCTLLDLEYIPIADRKMIPEVSKAYYSLKKEGRLGTQYKWLSCFSKDHPGIELSVQKEGRMDYLVNKCGAFKTINDPVIGIYCVVDIEKSSVDIVNIFGNFHFPIVNLTKLEMRDEYIRLGSGDIIDMTWFCHRPKGNEPCGICPPCGFVVEEGLSYRLSPKALKRYKARKNRNRRKQAYKNTVNAVGRMLPPKIKIRILRLLNMNMKK